MKLCNLTHGWQKYWAVIGLKSKQRLSAPASIHDLLTGHPRKNLYMSDRIWASLEWHYYSSIIVTVLFTNTGISQSTKMYLAVKSGKKKYSIRASWASWNTIGHLHQEISFLYKKGHQRTSDVLIWLHIATVDIIRQQVVTENSTGHQAETVCNAAHQVASYSNCEQHRSAGGIRQQHMSSSCNCKQHSTSGGIMQ